MLHADYFYSYSALTAEVARAEAAEEALSGAVEALETAKFIKEINLAKEGYQSEISATTVNQVVTFDFSNMIIDCGEY